MPGTTGPDRWLFVLWPTSILFHLLGNSANLAALNGIGLLQLVLVASAITTIVSPRQRHVGLVAAVYLAVLWWKMPVVGNHEVLLGLMAFTILLSVPVAHRSGVGWPVVAAPAFRLIYLVGYGFIALSKLNRGFFDAAVSCAVLFGDALLGPFGPGGGGFGVPAWLVIGATAAIELLIPVLLATGRFRYRGLVLALGFHFILALDPASHVFDFSATLLPMFCLFGSPRFRAELDRLTDHIRHRPTSEVTLGLVVIASVHGLILVMLTRLGGPVPVWTVGYLLWLVVGGGILFLALRSVRSDQNRNAVHETAYLNRFRHTPVLLVVVLLAVTNGLGPYLEYRTAAAFNMYSNLVITDGESNSVVPAILPAGQGSNTVAVLSAAPGSDLDHYVVNNLRLPTENLDRYLRENPEEDPLIQGQDGPVTARSVGYGDPGRDGILATAGRLLQHKLAFRRAVDGTGQHRCLRSWGPLG